MVLARAAGIPGNSVKSTRAAARLRRRLATQLKNLTGCCVRERRVQLGSERQQVLETIGLGPENEHSEWAVVEALLLRQALVDGDERVEPAGNRIEQRAVVEVSPAHLVRGLDPVSYTHLTLPTTPYV